MKRKLNENARLENELNLDNVVKICVSDIRKDDDSVDCNELRDIFVEEGAHVDGSHAVLNGEPATIMTVVGLPEDQVIDILSDFLEDSNCANAEAYIQEPESEEFLDDEEMKDFPAYEDVKLDPEEDALNDELDEENDMLNEAADVLDDAKDELRGLLKNLGPNDNITFEPEVVLDGEDNAAIISIDCNGDMETADGDNLNAFELSDSDDVYTLCDVVKDELDNEAAYPAYDDVDLDDEDDQPRFEKIKKGRHLDEKKKGCCPGTKTINEDVVSAVLADIDSKAINESNKINEQQQKALEVKTLKALTENRYSLHTNVRYNGKSFDKMTLKELKNLYETVKSSVDTLNERTLNESVVDQKIIDTINNKKKLLEFIDEEITYRVTRHECLKKLNEDGAEISDEELANLFGPAQGEDTPTEEKSDDAEEEKSEEKPDDAEEKDSEESKDENNDEEVELSRIEITLKDEAAAKDLKQACLDADIPEDAIELENVEDDTFEEGEEESEEESEEGSEEENADNEEETSEEGTNESYEYAKYVKLLAEGEAAEEAPAEGEEKEEPAEEPAEGEESGEESEDNEEDEEEKQPKFILTNTDYAAKLAKVLEDVYGISKEEFEDMIGGQIVEEEPKEEEESGEDAEEKSEEDSEESKEEGSEEKKDDEEEIDPSDLFKNL